MITRSYTFAKHVGLEGLLRRARVAITPRSWVLKRALSNGAIVCGRNRPGHGGRGVYLHGDALEPELQHLEQFLSRDAIFIDVGANTGMFTLKAATHLNQGMVIAIEPGLEVLIMLAYSVRLNELRNVRLRNLCIAEQTGEDKLWLNRDKPNAFSLVRRSDCAETASVLAVSLDDLCTWEGLTRLDYVKVDVVGAEDQVLAGASQVISRFHPIFQLANPNGVQITLPQYSAYRAPSGSSVNTVLIPDGDERAERFKSLGWRTVDVEHANPKGLRTEGKKEPEPSA